jgi:hypothetical protein
MLSAVFAVATGRSFVGDSAPPFLPELRPTTRDSDTGCRFETMVHMY